MVGHKSILPPGAEVIP